MSQSNGYFDYPVTGGLEHCRPLAECSAMAMLSDWPVERPADGVDFVNGPQTQQEDDWRKATVAQLGLRWTLRPRGRPRKTTENQVN